MTQVTFAVGDRAIVKIADPYNGGFLQFDKVTDWEMVPDYDEISIKALQSNHIRNVVPRGFTCKLSVIKGVQNNTMERYVTGAAQAWDNNQDLQTTSLTFFDGPNTYQVTGAAIKVDSLGSYVSGKEVTQKMTIYAEAWQPM